jgi:hypothetical protein
MTKWHRSLEDRFALFPQEQQLLMVANELNRANHQLNHPHEYRRALERGLELLDLLCRDHRWKKSLPELRRAREVMASHFCQLAPSDVSVLQKALIALHSKSWKMLR